MYNRNARTINKTNTLFFLRNPYPELALFAILYQLYQKNETLMR